MKEEPQDWTVEIRHNFFGTKAELDEFIKGILHDGYVTAIFDKDWEER